MTVNELRRKLPNEKACGPSRTLRVLRMPPAVHSDDQDADA